MSLGRAGSDVQYAGPGGGEPVPAYHAAPESGRGRGVIVLHEAFGLVDPIRDACDRLAREGFVALAPDLFRGRTAADPQRAAAFLEGLDPDAVGADIEGAVAALLNDPGVDGSRVGAVGFCMGGALALFAAARSPRVGAVVDFYGVFPGLPIELGNLRAAVLAFFGAEDEFVSADSVRDLRVSLQAAGVRHAIQTVKAVGHGFMNEARADRYDARAAAESWDAVLAFLRAELQ